MKELPKTFEVVYADAPDDVFLLTKVGDGYAVSNPKVPKLAEINQLIKDLEQWIKVKYSKPL